MFAGVCPLVFKLKIWFHGFGVIENILTKTRLFYNLLHKLSQSFSEHYFSVVT
jgi:hypothetical protein